MVKRYSKVFAIAACLPAVAMGASYGGGAGTSFTYTNAQDVNGSFGMPIPAGDDIFFPFATFSASASGGNPNVMDSDTLDMDLQANVGLRFDQITLITNGTRTITGTPGANSVEAIGTLDILGTAGDAFVGNDGYNFFDDQPGAAGAFWSESAGIVIPFGTQVTELHLTVSQLLNAVATDGTSQITATFEIVGVAISVVPEPSSMALIGLGGLALLRRRR